MKNTYNSEFCEITYLQEYNAVLCTWKQFCQGKKYQDPLMFGLELLQNLKCTTWITDTTNGFENKESDTKWLLEEFLPQTINSSCKNIAFIMKEDSPLKMEIENQITALNQYFNTTIIDSLHNLKKTNFKFIEQKVKTYYWQDDINCATTMIKVLAEIFDIEIHPQVIQSAVGMHGAGEYGAQCGLVEGLLMFLGIYGREKGLDENSIIQLCNKFANAFELKYTSLLCKELRPEGFKEENPPHLCEGFTSNAIQFAKEFIENEINTRFTKKEYK